MTGTEKAPKTEEGSEPRSLKMPRGEVRADRDPAAPGIQDSLLTRLFLTPLLCVSFLLSLLLVDTRNHERSHRDSSATGNIGARPRLPWLQKEGDAWVWTSRKRKIMRAEMGQAFEVRRWIMVALVLFGVMTMGAGVLVMQWVWGRVGCYAQSWRLGWA